MRHHLGSQWRVAAKRPQGLAAIVPHEGMSDYYRDRCRHGGILSNNFINFWWNRQVITNQYGRPGRSKSRWGEDTIEGDLDEAELAENCRDQNVDNVDNPFLDDEYHDARTFRLEDIEVPLLSVANWGGITLHLRGNVEGYTWAGSKQKFLRFIVGRHDLPFYYDEEVEVHRSFMDAFLKDDDYAGWKSGKMPPVSVCLRKGDVGFNNPEGELTFPRRDELEWPIARTEYTKYFLTPDLVMGNTPQSVRMTKVSKLSYDAGDSSIKGTKVLEFKMRPSLSELEVTGNLVAHLAVSVDSKISPPPDNLELDLFLTLRHFTAAGTEIPYTGSSGDAVPVTKGWLRTSLRKVNSDSPYHRPYLPRREYRSIDVQPVQNGTVYEVDVEMWPTNVVVEKGGYLVLQVASEDTDPGVGLFKHNSPVDRYVYTLPDLYGPY
jgi:predicted acyl esterase